MLSQEAIINHLNKYIARNDKHLMQSTGIYDKNDNPIYEGDIVVCIEEKFNKNNKVIEVFKGYLEWSDNEITYYLVNNSTKVKFQPAKYIDIEVIGNIYEHPKLMKELV
jgi:uncharacterized phage protein (TIGR01671 family)